MKKTVQFQGKTLTQEEAVAMLKEHSMEGLKQCYGDMTPEVLAQRTEQISYELDRIAQAKNGLEGFVLMWDLVRYAREHDLFLSPEGVYVGSLTAYCLGLNDLDPIQHGLSFQPLIRMSDITGRDENPEPSMSSVLNVSVVACKELRAYLQETYGYGMYDRCPVSVGEDESLTRDELICQAVAAATGEPLRLDQLDLCDQKVFRFISSGTVRHVSSEFRSILRKQQPTSIDELTVAEAFASRKENMLSFFTRRCRDPKAKSDRLLPVYLKRREQGVRLEDPALQSILGETCGCPIYTEQFIALHVQHFGGPAYRVEDLDPRELVEPLYEKGVPSGDPFLGGESYMVMGKGAYLERALSDYRRAYLQYYYPVEYAAASRKASRMMAEYGKVILNELEQYHQKRREAWEASQ